MDVFQLAIFFEAHEEQLVAQLLRSEFCKITDCNYCEESLPEMISDIAEARGIKPSEVERLLLNEAWEFMIAERYLRKWPGTHNTTVLKKKPSSVPVSPELSVQAGAGNH